MSAPLRAADFRKNALAALRGKWGIALVTGIVASILGGADFGGGTFNFDINVELPPPGEGTTPEAYLNAFGALLPTILLGLLFSFLFTTLAFFLLGSVVQVGYASFNLALIDRAPATINLLFAHFRQWGRIVVTSLLRALYVSLLSLLFVIPGIIAAYSYALVPYLLAEHPTLSSGEVLATSRRLMKGNRLRLFCLHISFIGWLLLASCCTCGIGSLFLSPYRVAAEADFYREITGTRVAPPTDGSGEAEGTEPSSAEA